MIRTEQNTTQQEKNEQGWCETNMVLAETRCGKKTGMKRNKNEKLINWKSDKSQNGLKKKGSHEGNRKNENR